MPPKRKTKKRPRGPTTVPPEDLIDPVQRKEILKAFERSLDGEKDTLSIRESKRALKELGVDVKSEEIRSLSNEEEDIQLDESSFLHFAALKLTQLEKSNKAFDLIDTGGKGVVVVQDLARVAKELDEDLTEEELVEMMDFVDRSGDGMLSRKDFARIAKKVHL
ncbi:unnamed protein product [Cylindrotheca closterium]|uniref:EF-hand domain-containing protein n=1 Tax=Cylindrotheca closterium TaxID=2856 RepID=A0AAD2JK97_9STRA|nr:unnamed protein product [Cylindrotheca closterium]